ncbi:hypothetical protein QEH40_gp10 [Microbacterium phage OscarSo]|uniref:Uncharacterized protein n=1 Tax=Microbacterium phage OscarSo TaxID=2985324 RepID=A0A9X9P5M5_9CAUD|nr:hypothetical protein QEH40_gp10 [Microbacterium phage OscarSo]UYL87131.1 hypothetical protein SEA_OSCARSO_10 [Microbacterium phage OscarSo]
MGLKLIEGFKAFGKTVGGAQIQLLTDAVGRMKISHAQPPNTVGSVSAVADAVAIAMDSLSDVIFYFKGAAHAGFNLTFEQSPDSTDGIDGAWFPVLAKNQGASGTVSSTTGALSSNGSSSYAVSAPGASYVRARVTARTSGTLEVIASGSTAARPTDLTATLSSSAVTIGASATSIGKAEDAAHASGDVGVPALGVRQPATPTTPTSAAGDYGVQLLDREGKLVISGNGAPEVSFQSYTNLTGTGDVALRASGGAGIRNYVTDLVLENTGGSAARVLVKDGTTVIFSATVPAGNTLALSFRNPIFGTAATALNAALGAAGTVSVTLSGFLGV